MEAKLLHIGRILAGRTWALAAAALLSAGCTTTMYFKPTATRGEASEQSYGCPGPKNVLLFSPQDIPWVHLRVYVNAPNAVLPTTTLRIEFHSQMALGVGDSNGSEFRRRQNRTFELTAESSRVVLIYSDGRQSVFPSRLLTGTQHLHSISGTVDLGSETMNLSDSPIDGFSIQIPAIFIDGSKIDVPLITFKLVRGSYEAVLNC
jgi:hypothetical protein